MDKINAARDAANRLLARKMLPTGTNLPMDVETVAQAVLNDDVARADLAAEVTDWRGESEEWRNLVDSLFHGEESPMFARGRLVYPACVDCGRDGEDISDIEHEDGCVVGPLYHKLLATRPGE